MAFICGIDEAGRGPVIGPMVMCGVVIDESEMHKLVSIGVKDSKLLTHAQREAMFEQVKDAVSAYEIAVINPPEIDKEVMSATSSLNDLEAINSVKIIKKLNPDKAILDCPSTNTKAYTLQLKRDLEDIEIIAEHKADLNYPIVSAASILAKVTRDREIERLKREIGDDFGSGYTSDPLTQKFLEENWDKYPLLFRKSWASWKLWKEKKIQKGLFEFQ